MNEQLYEIIEHFKATQETAKVTCVFFVALILVEIGMFIWQIIRLTRIKKYIKEYKTTLTEEQLKAIENLNKLKA